MASSPPSISVSGGAGPSPVSGAGPSPLPDAEPSPVSGAEPSPVSGVEPGPVSGVEPGPAPGAELEEAAERLSAGNERSEELPLAAAGLAQPRSELPPFAPPPAPPPVSWMRLYPLSPMVVIPWIFSQVVQVSFLMGIVVWVRQMRWWWLPSWAFLLLGGGLFVLAVCWPFLSYRAFSFEVRPESLLLSEGVLWRSCSAVPHVRIQHVDTRRSPLERWLGLSTLLVFTAGSSGADVVVSGLPPKVAEELRDRLVRLRELAG